MRGEPRRHEDELLVVHTPRPPADRAGREPVTALDGIPVADVAGLAARLRGTPDAGERARLLAAIQRRFGNAFAGLVADAVDREAPDEEPR